jgi:hypothetical protein
LDSEDIFNHFIYNTQNVMFLCIIIKKIAWSQEEWNRININPGGLVSHLTDN